MATFSVDCFPFDKGHLDVVVSGDDSLFETILEQLRQDGFRCQVIKKNKTFVHKLVDEDLPCNATRWIRVKGHIPDVIRSCKSVS